MKKIFTLLMAAAAITSVSAQTSTTLFEDADAPMLTWSVACEVSAAQVSGIKAGDQFVVTVNAREASTEWPKFGFEMDGESLYPDVFEMWGDKTFPLNATYTVSVADAELLANGFEIKGDGVQITKVVFVQNEAEELPEGQSVIYNNPDSQMLSWSALCNVIASQVEGIQAGDQFVVTVNARQEGNEWPKFGFEMDGESLYPEEFEMWGDKTFPCEVTYTVSVADAKLLANGFEIKGDGVQITKVVFIQYFGDVNTDIVLWSGESTLMTWGAGPTVVAGKAASIEAGDQIAITVDEILLGADNWPKIICRCEDGWDEIFSLELNKDDYTAADFPLVKEVNVTAEMLPSLLKGFNFGGESAYISKVTLIKGGSTGIKEIVNEKISGMVSVYNLNGVCIRHNVEAAYAIKGLPAGLYIVGGKKVLVK